MRAPLPPVGGSEYGFASYHRLVTEAVPMDTLWERVAEFGDHPFLITVSGDGRIHSVSVTGRVEDDAYVVGVGRTSNANIADHPAVSLLWPPADGGAYSLIVDGTAERAGDDGETQAVHPTRAVLHRVAGVPDDVPSCVPLIP